MKLTSAAVTPQQIVKLCVAYTLSVTTYPVTTGLDHNSIEQLGGQVHPSAESYDRDRVILSDAATALFTISFYDAFIQSSVYELEERLISKLAL